MLSKEWLQGCKMMAGPGVMFQSDAVKALLDHIAELEENATAQALALKAAKAMQQSETERADDNERDAKRYRWLLRQAWFQDACYRYDLEDGGRQNKFEELLGITIDQAMRHP